jgi:hypothetical protein
MQLKSYSREQLNMELGPFTRATRVRFSRITHHVKYSK